MNNTIILIGPLATGKSTIALQLSELTGLHNYPVDRLKWYYRFKNGYDLQKGTSLLKKKGFEELIEYADTYFGAKELKEILSSFSGIIDLGATDTYCKGFAKQHELQQLFAPFPNIFLILPSRSIDKCIDELENRIKKRYANHEFKDAVLYSYLEKNKAFIESQSNRLFAKHIIYTEGKSATDVAKEILLKSKFYEYERTIANL